MHITTNKTASRCPRCSTLHGYIFVTMRVDYSRFLHYMYECVECGWKKYTVIK